MKNKKKFLKFTAFGFTLIELLGVLIILAVIALITFPIIDKILLNAKEKAYERQKDNLVEAARLYVTNRADYTEITGTISFNTLINEGFLEASEILDPRDSSKKMPGCITYNWSDKKNQYIFEYSENCAVTTAASCFKYEKTNIVDSFIINYDACMTYFTDLEWYSQEDRETYCKGGYAEDSGSFWTLKIDIALGEVDVQELKNNNVISNVVESEGVEITGYDNICGGKSVIVPKNIDGEPIVSIGERAFITGDNKTDSFINDINMSNATELKIIKSYSFPANNIVNVELPLNLEYIGDSAFAGNQLTSITIPSSVTYLGKDAFRQNQIQKIDIPPNLNFLQSGVFADNQLTNVTIPDNIIGIGSYAFAFNQLTNVTIPDSVIGIGSYAFASNQLTNVIIPDSVITIGDGSFGENELTSIIIPNSVTTIGTTAFAVNQLTSITIPNSVVYMGYATFNDNQLSDEQAFIYLRNADGTEDKSTIISYGGSKRDNLIIPNNITTIEMGAFVGNQLTSVTIPNSVTKIGSGAFNNNQLTNIIIPNSVTEIGSLAFAFNQLTNVTIPNSVTKIGSYAFQKALFSNPNLTTITNQTGKAFDWGQIVNGDYNETEYNFETGTVVNSAGNVEIVK